MKLNDLPFMEERLKIGRLNTPIRFLERLSRKYGVNLYVKRDDLTGIALSGNKIRKLEYLLYDAIRLGADTVITGGAPQSNHCRATAAACRMVGLDPVLVFMGNAPERIEGNLFLDKLCGAELHYVQSDDFWVESDDIMKRIAEELRREGRNPYVIPIGGSNAAGYRGYLRAGMEIIDQETEMNVRFEHIFCAAGTVGTLGGLVLARMLGKWERDIVGISVAQNAGFFTDQIKRNIADFAEQNGLELPEPEKHFRLSDDYIGPGYGVSTEPERELILELAREEGLFLDPVYTGKTWWGMIDLIRKGEIEKGANVLFLHTGGIFGLLAQTEAFEGEI